MSSQEPAPEPSSQKPELMTQDWWHKSVAYEDVSAPPGASGYTGVIVAVDDNEIWLEAFCLSQRKWHTCIWCPPDWDVFDRAKVGDAVSGLSAITVHMSDNRSFNNTTLPVRRQLLEVGHMKCRASRHEGEHEKNPGEGEHDKSRCSGVSSGGSSTRKTRSCRPGLLSLH